MVIQAAKHAAHYTAHLLVLVRASDASCLRAHLTKWGSVALATMLDLAALLHQYIISSPADKCTITRGSPAHSVDCTAAEAQSDGFTSACASDVDGTLRTSRKAESSQEQYEAAYAHNCPALADEDTTGYVSDRDAEEDCAQEDAAQVLQRILPYLKMAVAAYDSTSMTTSEFAMIHKSQLISNVIDPTHLFGPVGVTDTEVHVCVLHDKSIVFAFRGTEPTEWRNGFADVLTDLAQGQDTLKLYDGSSEPVYTSQPHIRVHRGFQLALKDVTDTDIPSQNLRLVLQGLGVQAKDVGSVICVGHSLGGALATLCAKWCREVAFPRAKIGCVTIGSPRVGNEAFAADFDSKVTNGLSYRIVNKRDIVPSIPNLITYPAFGYAYKHVSKPIYLYDNEAGEISAQLGGDRPTIFNLGFFDHPSHSYLDSVQQLLQATNPYFQFTH